MKDPTGRQNRSERNAIRAGEPTTFDALFDRNAARVRGYLFRLTGSRSDAEDLTQETFLAAYRGCDAFGKSERGSALAWLLGIAYRRWRDGRRNQQAALVFAPLNEETEAVNDDFRGDHAGRVAISATLEAAMQKLKPAERECLLLTAVEGLTYAEAARILGEPAGTIKWRVHEATRALRRILSAAEERYEATNTPDISVRTEKRHVGRN